MQEEVVQITAFVRPHKLEEVKSAVAIHPISGLSVSDVRGSGNNPESAASIGGLDVVVPLPVRSKLVIVVRKELQEPVIEAILEAARTGSPGDGKIFVEPVCDVARVRTGERGFDSL